jgi:hypothetical protein
MQGGNITFDGDSEVHEISNFDIAMGLHMWNLGHQNKILIPPILHSVSFCIHLAGKKQKLVVAPIHSHIFPQWQVSHAVHSLFRHCKQCCLDPFDPVNKRSSQCGSGPTDWSVNQRQYGQHQVTLSTACIVALATQELSCVLLTHKNCLSPLFWPGLWTEGLYCLSLTGSWMNIIYESTLFLVCIISTVRQQARSKVCQNSSASNSNIHANGSSNQTAAPADVEQLSTLS